MKTRPFQPKPVTGPITMLGVWRESKKMKRLNASDKVREVITALAYNFTKFEKLAKFGGGLTWFPKFVRQLPTRNAM